MVQDIAQLERGQLRPEELGLTLTEAKRNARRPSTKQFSSNKSLSILNNNIRARFVTNRDRKRAAHHRLRTLFGKLELKPVRGCFTASCQPQPTRSFSPLAELFVERTSPELLYLEAKFASLVSYGLSMKLLEEALPIGAEINASRFESHSGSGGGGLESELGDEQAFFIEGVSEIGGIAATRICR